MSVDLTQLKSLLDAASPGPWEGGAPSYGPCTKTHGPEEKGPWHGNGFCHLPEIIETDDDNSIVVPETRQCVAGTWDYDCGGIARKEDRDLIVALRNAAPDLIAEVERLREVVKFYAWDDDDGVKARAALGDAK